MTKRKTYCYRAVNVRTAEEHDFYYANVSNAIKFGLAKDGISPGIYRIYVVNGLYETFLQEAYKRA